MAINEERHLESLPVSPDLLESASRWYNISWWSLIIFGSIAAVAALGTVVSTLLQFWSGGVLDRHTNWRTATLEKETAQAKRELVKSQERIAELGKETAEANKQAAEAKLELPGSKHHALDAAQQTQLIEELKSFAGQQYSFNVFPDPEPIGLMRSINDVLKAAG